MSIDEDFCIDELEDLEYEVEDISEIFKPGKYKVIIMNDDHTPFDWVIEVLMSIFRKGQDEAKRLTLEIHEKGSAVAGVYSYEIAEQKVFETISASRENGFPLQATDKTKN